MPWAMAKKPKIIAAIHNLGRVSRKTAKPSGQTIARHPEWGLDQRRFLHRIDLTADTIELDNVVHPLKDKHFRTLNAADPYALSHEEAACLAQLRTSFLASQKLRDQVGWMVARGRMYLVREGHLIFHGCVPTNEQGEFLPMPLLSERFSGVFPRSKPRQSRVVSNNRRRWKIMDLLPPTWAICYQHFLAKRPKFPS